jgi:hypothetical protein
MLFARDGSLARRHGADEQCMPYLSPRRQCLIGRPREYGIKTASPPSAAGGRTSGWRGPANSDVSADAQRRKAAGADRFGRATRFVRCRSSPGLHASPNPVLLDLGCGRHTTWTTWPMIVLPTCIKRMAPHIVPGSKRPSVARMINYARPAEQARRSPLR